MDVMQVIQFCRGDKNTLLEKMSLLYKKYFFDFFKKVLIIARCLKHMGSPKLTITAHTQKVQLTIPSKLPTIYTKLSHPLQTYDADNALFLTSPLGPVLHHAALKVRQWCEVSFMTGGLKSLITARFNGWHDPLLHPAGHWGGGQ